jgi:hypothetical protein
MIRIVLGPTFAALAAFVFASVITNISSAADQGVSPKELQAVEQRFLIKVGSDLKGDNNTEANAPQPPTNLDSNQKPVPCDCTNCSAEHCLPKSNYNFYHGWPSRWDVPAIDSSE